MQTEIGKLKQSLVDGDQNNQLSSQERLEIYQNILKRLDQLNNAGKELTRNQRLLTSKGHRIDQRPGGDLTINLKNLEGQMHHEIERVQRNIQAENDFRQLEKDFENELRSSNEQFRLVQEQSGDKTLGFQTIADRLQQSELELNKLIHLAERLKNELPRSQYEQLQRTIRSRQETLQNLIKLCQQARGENEQLVKSQTKLSEELTSIHDWFKRLLNDHSLNFDLNFSLNHVNDLQDSLAVRNFARREREKQKFDFDFLFSN